MKPLSGRSLSAVAAVVVQAAALGGCVLLADVNRTNDSHIVDDSGIGFNVTMDADHEAIHVALDTEQSVEKRLLWGATFGLNQGPSATEFDSVASKWVNFQHPECKVGQGRRVSMEAYVYGLTCTSPTAPK